MKLWETGENENSNILTTLKAILSQHKKTVEQPKYQFWIEKFYWWSEGENDIQKYKLSA